MPSFDNIALVFRTGWGIGTVVSAVCGAIVLAGLWNRPARRAVSRRLYFLLAGIQVLAATLLVLYLVNPRLRYQKKATEKGAIAVVADTSVSMSARDTLDHRSRYDQIHQLLLGAQSPLQATLKEKGPLHFFAFSSTFKEVSVVAMPTRPDPAGLETDLAGALEALGNEARGRGFQAIVLASDGLDTGAENLTRIASELRAPVYAIGVGRKRDPSEPWRNVGVLAVDVPTRVTVNQEVEVLVKIRQEGYDNVPSEVQLLQDGQLLDSAPLELTGAPRQRVSLKCRPTRKGTQNYRIEILAPTDDRIEADNALDFSAMVVSHSIRVLYVEGRLRWVYKFLRRVLESEETIEADCVIRTGPGKLYQQGKSKLRLRNALPADFEGSTEYDVIILGDFPRLMLPDAQLKLLDRFVRENKGGLMVIGGDDTLASGEFVGSLLEPLLPAKLAPSPGKAATDGAPPRPTITTLGQTSSLLAGLDNVVPRMPLRRVHETGGAKPGAQVLIEAQRNDGSRAPVLITQRYGEGRTMLLTTEDIWKTSLRESGRAEKSPTARFWIQALQWLVQKEEEGDEESPLLAGRTDKSYYDPGEPVTIEAVLRKPAKGKAWGEVAGRVTVMDLTGASGPEPQPSEGPVVSALKFPEVSEEGTAQITWTPPHDGCFDARLVATREGQREEVHCRFTVGRPHQELDQRGLNEDLLREIARETGGGYYTPLNAQDIPEAIDSNPVATRQMVEADLVDSPWLFLAFCGFVGTGWALRRRKNLI